MTRIGKKAERRGQSPRKHKPPAVKTGPKKDQLPKGYKEHENAVVDSSHGLIFISKVK